MKFKRIKAGALQLTMFIMVVIALLLAGFILLVHTHKMFKVQTNFVAETVDNSNKGIQHVLQNSIPLQDTVAINLYDEDYKTLKVYRDYWGLFEMVTSNANIKTKTFQKVALIGSKQPKQIRTALYVEDHNQPLVVVGNTRIQGDVYVSKRGVRSGNIAGHSYYGDQLIYGTQHVSTALPKLSNELIGHLENINEITNDVGQDRFLDLNEKWVHHNSFFKLLQIVYSDSDLVLLDVELTGHILVQSKTKIIVDASSKLRDVVLVAPKIEVKDFVEGNFQLFATDEISIGKACNLKYPSAIVLNRKASENDKLSDTDEIPILKIDKDSSIKGMVVYLGTNEPNTYRPQLIIEENTTIHGEVYCEGNLELKGNVLGSVFADKFVANQSGSMYQNHIYNGTIIVDGLPEQYVGLPLQGSKKEVMKWMY